jgi:hypothetical protein
MSMIACGWAFSESQRPSSRRGLEFEVLAFDGATETAGDEQHIARLALAAGEPALRRHRAAHGNGKHEHEAARGLAADDVDAVLLRDGAHAAIDLGEELDLHARRGHQGDHGMPWRAAHGREVAHHTGDGLATDELRRRFEREMHVLHQRVGFEQRVLVFRAADDGAVIASSGDDIAVELHAAHEAADELVFSDFGKGGHGWTRK